MHQWKETKTETETENRKTEWHLATTFPMPKHMTVYY